jgi:UDP-N-acetylmuramate dehydrogenase
MRLFGQLSGTHKFRYTADVKLALNSIHIFMTANTHPTALIASNAPIAANVNLQSFNTFGIAVHAKRLVSIDSVESLRSILLAEKDNSPRLILGGGSNILLTQDFPGLVMRMRIMGKRIVSRDDAATLVEAGAGENWHEFVRWTLDHGLAGLENLSLIPGTVGAAPIQNIGAYGVEMKDTFHSLMAMNVTDGSLEKFDRDDCEFAYRDSVFKGNLTDRYAITHVTFRLPNAVNLHLDYGELRAELSRINISEPIPLDVSNAVINIRQRKLPDPVVIGNVGSFFKNPIVAREVLTRIQAQHPQMPHYAAPDDKVKLAAGWLIERCGWKGKSIGRAGVHDQHALVLVNRGGATGAELLTLARTIQASVLEKFAVELESEPVIV